MFILSEKQFECLLKAGGFDPKKLARDSTVCLVFNKLFNFSL